ncbi:flagellar basal-body MS-ring/collar protein FliF [Neobacillus drentensis]|uniref:flagellar basal-body MS-ring/collar protein FliF n=1 Tax=Neobacillus drentensis TaxID=220684 RepID=UPI00285AC826|nr:flagellar basal-body MS-ring/collar protein FliF [Neobacillus drentensis]MDR7235717.1 flagellar M-ring protein FliF [Neobacillus drentensis]
MNRSWIDQIKHTGENFSEYWKTRSGKQKGFFLGTFLFIIIALSTFIFFASRTEYVPLYSGQLTQREVGDIKAELDKQGQTDYKISDNGTMLLVPKKAASDLVVNLASKGYPKDNKINYDIFSQNLSFGATDRQYNILEREAMQNQVANVLTHVDGIKNAEVIVTLPEDSVFIRQGQDQTASASVMVEVEPGVQLNSQQIRALYTLVSRSVPKLPVDNITIMNQYSETLALQDANKEDQTIDKYDEQRKIQQNLERDIQQNLQGLLGTILGNKKVYVHTFLKMNFDKVKTEENLVKPVDQNNQGIVISSDKSSKTATGTGSSAGGIVGTGETDVPGYTGASSGGDSSYEESNSKVNYEVNRINNEIIKSPYQIEDITINVGVEADPSTPNKLPRATQDNIQNIIANTVRTALGHPNLSQQEIDQRITIFPHSFATNTMLDNGAKTNWLYIAGGIALAMLLIGGLIWWLVSRRKQNQLDLEEELAFSAPVEEPDYFAEEEMGVERQLKKLLDQRPEDFSKVIRTLLHEEEA